MVRIWWEGGWPGVDLVAVKISIICIKELRGPVEVKVLNGVARFNKEKYRISSEI